MTREECILLGTIAKTHGVRGELILRTPSNSFDLEQDWESVFLQIEGILVPFFISVLKPFKAGEWVVKFDWYEDKNTAEKLVGFPVWVHIDQHKPSDPELYMDELIGYVLTDTTSGRQGRITDFMDIPENPVFEAEIDGYKILIPAREDFILEVDSGKQTVTFELPEGLI